MAACVSNNVYPRHLPQNHATQHFRGTTCCAYRYNRDYWVEDEFDCATLVEQLEQAATTYLGGPCKHHLPEPVPLPAPRIQDPIVNAVKGGVKLGANIAVAGAKLAQDIPLVVEASTFVVASVKNAGESSTVKASSRRVRREAKVIKDTTMAFLDGVSDTIESAKKLVTPAPKKEIVYKTKKMESYNWYEGESRDGKKYEEDSDDEDESWEFI